MKEAITSKDFCLQPTYTTASPVQAIHLGQNIMRSHFEILYLYDLKFGLSEKHKNFKKIFLMVLTFTK